MTPALLRGHSPIWVLIYGPVVGTVLLSGVVFGIHHVDLCVAVRGAPECYLPIGREKVSSEDQPAALKVLCLVICSSLVSTGEER